jgi:hypothetical protein
MYNKRWFKVLVAVVLLASVAFAASPSGAAASLLAVGSNCAAALRQGVGTVMPSQLSDREMCYLVRGIQGGPSSTVAVSPAAGVARLAAPVLPEAGWQDAGAARPSAAPVAPAAAGYYFRFPTHVEGHGQ